jgi:hypothetical protein
VPNTTYYFRAVVSSASVVTRGATLSFTTPRLPSVTTIGRDPNTPQGYTVTGTVTPNGNATTAWFEYGTSPTFASPTATSTQAVGSASSPVTVARTLSVQPLTTYYVRMVGRNVAGTTTGNVVSFTTGYAPSLTSSGRQDPIPACVGVVDVYGTGDPNGEYAVGYFEYSRDARMATYSTTPAQPLGSGTNPVRFDRALSHGGAVLYFRAVVSNMFGVVRGFTFTINPPVCVK